MLTVVAVEFEWVCEVGARQFSALFAGSAALRVPAPATDSAAHTMTARINL
jgi:hypothetical protein